MYIKTISYFSFKFNAENYTESLLKLNLIFTIYLFKNNFLSTIYDLIVISKTVFKYKVKGVSPAPKNKIN